MTQILDEDLTIDNLDIRDYMFTSADVLEFERHNTSIKLYNLEGRELIPGTRYRWRVKAFNDQVGESEWSDVWYFSTAVATPELISPKNGKKNVSTSLTCKWQKISGATGYKIEIYDIINNSLLLSEQVSKNIFKAILEPGFYSWRVKALNQKYGNSKWSDIWEFKISLLP